MAKRTTKKKARRAPRKAKRKATRRRTPVVVYNFAKPKRRRATVKRKVAKKTTRRRSRRGIAGTINGAMNTKGLMNAALGGLKVYGGSRGARIIGTKIGAGVDPNMKAAGFILLGALFHGKAPDIMKGVIAEGVGMIADPMLIEAGVMTGVINGYLSPDEADAVEEAALNGADDSDY